MPVEPLSVTAKGVPTYCPIPQGQSLPWLRTTWIESERGAILGSVMGKTSLMRWHLSRILKKVKQAAMRQSGARTLQRAQQSGAFDQSVLGRKQHRGQCGCSQVSAGRVAGRDSKDGRVLNPGES